MGSEDVIAEEKGTGFAVAMSVIRKLYIGKFARTLAAIIASSSRLASRP